MLLPDRLLDLECQWLALCIRYQCLEQNAKMRLPLTISFMFLGALDFAGGGPVHISSGSAGLAYALVLGHRRQLGEKHIYKPHNVTIVFLGTVLIWFGWFGFNGGSALNASMRGMVAVWNTNIAASMGVIGWTMFHYTFKGRKFTVVGACEGVIAGLVGITPAAGYVTPVSTLSWVQHQIDTYSNLTQQF